MTEPSGGFFATELRAFLARNESGGDMVGASCCYWYGLKMWSVEEMQVLGYFAQGEDGGLAMILLCLGAVS